MADREVEVSVNADGVDEAAGEMGGDAGAAGGVGSPGGGGGGGGGKGGGKIFGKLLTRLLGIIAFLGPILDVVKVFTDVATAFIAPVAVLLLRLLQPVLVLMLRVLPIWFDIMSVINDAAKIWADIRTSFVNAVLNGIGKVGGWLMDLPSKIWGFMKRLPSLIGSTIADQLPEFPDFGGGLGGGGDGFLSRIPGVGDDGGGPDDGDGPLVQIGGGLQPFVDRITQDGSFDFP